METERERERERAASATGQMGEKTRQQLERKHPLFVHVVLRPCSLCWHNILCRPRILLVTLKPGKKCMCLSCPLSFRGWVMATATATPTTHKTLLYLSFASSCRALLFSSSVIFSS